MWLAEHEKTRSKRLEPLLARVENSSEHSEEILQLTRGEIEEIKDTEVTHWVAVDDMPLLHNRSSWGKAMKGHFVHTDCDIGFVVERANLAIQILKGEELREGTQEGEEGEEDLDPGFFEE